MPAVVCHWQTVQACSSDVTSCTAGRRLTAVLCVMSWPKATLVRLMGHQVPLMPVCQKEPTNCPPRKLLLPDNQHLRAKCSLRAARTPGLWTPCESMTVSEDNEPVSPSQLAELISSPFHRRASKIPLEYQQCKITKCCLKHMVPYIHKTS